MALPFIFLSYSRKDETYVNTLIQALNMQKMSVWLDNRIEYGKTWPLEIQKHLKSCKVFILIMSSNSFQSHWVQCELQEALAAGKPIFPILLEGERWLSVSTIQYANVTNGELPSRSFFKEILDTLSADIKSPSEIRYLAKSKEFLSSSEFEEDKAPPRKARKINDKEKRLISVGEKTFDLNEERPFTFKHVDEVFFRMNKKELLNAIYEEIERDGVYASSSISRFWQDVLKWLDGKEEELQRRKANRSEFKSNRDLVKGQRQTKIIIEGQTFDLLSPLPYRKLGSLEPQGIVKLSNFVRENSIKEDLTHKSWLDWIK